MHRRVLHRQGRPGGAPAADRPRAGDPAAQDQAGGVLRLDRPRGRRHRPTATPASDQETTDRHRRRRPEHRLHRGRRLRRPTSRINLEDITAHALPRGAARARAARSRCASTRRPARSSARPPTITPTGDWQTFKDVTARPDQRRRPAPHELFLVFRNTGSTQNLFNVNWFEVVGKGAATTASPEVAVDGHADHRHRAAERSSSTRRRPTPTGPAPLTYAWDFGVPGITTDTSTAEDPSYTLPSAGHLHRLAARSPTPTAAYTTKSLTDQGRLRRPRRARAVRDDFNGTDLGAGWEVVRRDQTLVVSDGTLKIPAKAGDIYQTTNTATNIALRPMPAGAWTATAKIKMKGLVNFQQAGLHRLWRRRQLHQARPGGDQRHGQREVRVHQRGQRGRAQRHPGGDGEPRNRPRAGLLRADDLRRHEHHGPVLLQRDDLDQRGRAAALPANPRIGVLALANAAATTVIAEFDWLHARGPQRADHRLGAGDSFDGTSLNKTRWNAIVREDPTKYAVAGGGLTATTVAGDIYTNSDPAATRNFFLQTADHAGARTTSSKPSSGARSTAATPRAASSSTPTTTTTSSSTRSPTSTTRVSTGSLRSEAAAATVEPQPQVTNVPVWHDGHLAAPDEGRHQLQRRVQLRRPGVDVDRGCGRQRAGRAALRALHARRAGTRRRRHGDLRLLQGRRQPRLRDGHAEPHPGHLVGDGEPHGRRRAAAGAVQRRGDRPRQRHADLPLGLRQRRHRGRDGPDSEHDVCHRRHQERAAHGVRRQGRRQHPDDHRLGAARRRPGGALPGAGVLGDRRVPALQHRRGRHRPEAARPAEDLPGRRDRGQLAVP